MMEDDYQEQAELDSFTNNVKSSVKIKQTTRGPTWEIKVVTGEKDLIDDLMIAAIKVHQQIETKLGGKK